MWLNWKCWFVGLSKNFNLFTCIKSNEMLRYRVYLGEFATLEEVEVTTHTETDYNTEPSGYNNAN